MENKSASHPVNLTDFTEQAYLNYSMYVILDRALPHLMDGLKPVQRRIIYAMSELHLHTQAKPKKSARTIGDVIGKFHPHGDQACYESMVLLAQPFSTRYPLIEGQGNFGSIEEPKSFAAMRYTEAKLSKYSELLLSEITAGTTTLIPNFDSTLQEPLQLPAKLPFVLLNGASGIAVGMSTDIPPHNLSEICNALIHLVEHPNASLSTIMRYIPGPDFPSACELITPTEHIENIYASGSGALKLRATYHSEKNKIIVSALPFQCSPNKIIEQIANEMRLKKLPQVVDLRDEADQNAEVRIVIEVKNHTAHEAIMSHLFAVTDLEKNIRVHLNMIGPHGAPKVYTLLDTLNTWLENRKEAIRNKLRISVAKIDERLHILDGLLKIYLHIDEVIQVIRQSDDPDTALMSQFHLSKEQTLAILAIRLKQLAKMEQIKIQDEYQALHLEKQRLALILESEAEFKQHLKNELKTLRDQYGDKRRTILIERTEAQTISLEQILPLEDVLIILSQKGWIRSSKTQNIDPSTLPYKTGDKHAYTAFGKNTDLFAVMDQSGRIYNLQAHALPSARGFGEPLSSILKPPSGAYFIGLENITTPNQTFFCLSDIGYGFCADSRALMCKPKSGKVLLNAAPGKAKIFTSLPESCEYIAIYTTLNRFAILPRSEIIALAKGKGRRYLKLDQKQTETVIQAVFLTQKSDLMLPFGPKKGLRPELWHTAIGNKPKSISCVQRKKP